MSGLRLETVRDFDGVGQVVRKSECLNPIRRDEDGEAVGLMNPKRIIIDQVLDVLLDRPYCAFVGVDRAHLRNGGFEQILQLDTVCIRLSGYRRRPQKDRECRRSTITRKLFNLSTRRQINMQQDASPDVRSRRV